MWTSLDLWASSQVPAPASEFVANNPGASKAVFWLLLVASLAGWIVASMRTLSLNRILKGDDNIMHRMTQLWEQVMEEEKKKMERGQSQP